MVKIYDKYPLENTGGYVRETDEMVCCDEEVRFWSWKCLDCSTSGTGCIDREDAEEELWEHAEECRNG